MHTRRLEAFFLHEGDRVFVPISLYTENVSHDKYLEDQVLQTSVNVYAPSFGE